MNEHFFGKKRDQKSLIHVSLIIMIEVYVPPAKYLQFIIMKN
jgi:hypothetical protein